MSTSADLPVADIDRSPTLLLASLFAARRSGDDLLTRVYLRRLTALGIIITFAPLPTADDCAQGSVAGQEVRP